MKTYRYFALGSILLCSVQALAQHDPSMGPPKVLRIYREEIRPGKTAAHERVESGYVRAFKKAKQPFNYLAVASISGPGEAWFLEAHDSFAEIEQWDKLVEKDAPLRAELERLEEQDGALRVGQREILAVYREDLSFRPSVNIGQMRYFEIATFRVRPGHDMEFAEAAKMVSEAHTKAGTPEHYAVFQVVAGAPSGTYYVFIPMKTMGEIDTLMEPKNRMGAMTAMGEENWKKFQRLVSDSIMSSETSIYAFSPKMSNVSKEIASADPEFWTPKPKPAPKPADAKPEAPKSAAKQ